MLKTLLAAAALVAGLGVSSAIAAPAPAPATLGAVTLGASADAGLVDVHYRDGIRHFHSGRPHVGRRVYRDRYYRPRSGFSVQLELGTPRYRHVPRYRQVPVARYGGRHHAWCEGKYRSYRRYDGTFQPYHGPRKRCNSPYDGI